MTCHFLYLIEIKDILGMDPVFQCVHPENLLDNFDGCIQKKQMTLSQFS